MKNGTIEYLYDLANGGLDKETGKVKFDEEKLRRELDKNDRLLKNNKDIFEQEEKKSKTCPRYNPCPICFKCQNKASHLYVSCQTCKIPICTHTFSARDKMIKRKNFIHIVDESVMNYIKELDNDITKGQ